MDVRHETITFTELPSRAEVDPVLGSVLDVYEQHGHAAGYRDALRDVPLSLLEVTEDVIRLRDLSASDAGNLR